MKEKLTVTFGRKMCHIIISGQDDNGNTWMDAFEVPVNAAATLGSLLVCGEDAAIVLGEEETEGEVIVDGPNGYKITKGVLDARRLGPNG